MVIVIVHGVIIVLLVMLNFKYQNGDYYGGGVDKSNNGVDHDQWQLHFFCNSTQLVESGLLLDQLHLGSCAKRDRNKRTWELPQKIQL